MPSQTLRNRKKQNSEKKDAKKTDALTRRQEVATTSQLEPQQEESLWETFIKHPLVIVALVLAVPFSLHNLLHYLILQRPDLVQTATFGSLKLRPALDNTGARPLLLLGTLASGASIAETALREIARLEVAMERTNAKHYYCRDGTVSHTLGIRYAAASDPSRLAHVASAFCLHNNQMSPFNDDNNIYQHYIDTSSCWNSASCKAKECIQALSLEWGCALNNNCPTTFSTVLHIVQHPLRTLQELQAKTCPGQTRTPHPSFMQTAAAFIPISNDTNDNNEQEDEYAGMSCLEQLGWYVLNYNQALIQAQSAERIQYESITLCDIVKLAGFLDNSKGLQKRCSTVATKENGDIDDMHQPLKLLESIRDEHRVLPRLGWNDIANAELRSRLVQLTLALGYDPKQEM